MDFSYRITWECVSIRIHYWANQRGFLRISVDHWYMLFALVILVPVSYKEKCLGCITSTSFLLILGSPERWVTGDRCLFGTPARRVCVFGRVRHFAVGTAAIAWHRSEFQSFWQRNSLGLQPSKTKELVCEAMVDSFTLLQVAAIENIETLLQVVAIEYIESYRSDNVILSQLEELDKWASLGVNGHFTGPGSQRSQRKNGGFNAL